jgi:tetratricopeptide (TPR) repeat protein
VRTLRLAAGAACAAALLVSAHSASAISAEDALAAAQRSISEQQGGVGRIKSSMTTTRRGERTAEQRLADADLLYRTRDYERASVVFSEIVEKYPDQPTVYAEALNGLAETYYQSKQYLSAKRIYQRIVAEAPSSRRLAAYRGQAIARLTDIALRTHDVVSLDDLFARLNQEPPSSVEPMIAYARGRVLLAKGDYDGARRSLQAVPASAAVHHQAMYLLGVLALKEAQAKLAAAPANAAATPGADTPATPPAKRGAYVAAIDAFAAVTRLAGDTPDHQHIVDLAWLAVGRLLFESEQYRAAVDAYEHVDRKSPEFGTMLFEVATVYVQMGDMVRAQRALEVLSLIDPDSADAADAGLLRGDLELRAGQFKNARTTFEGIRSRFDPMRESVDKFLGSTSDPAVYYERLIEQQLDVVETSGGLPPLAVLWAREADDGPEAFAVVDEAVQTRKLLRGAQDLASRLTIVMTSPGKVRAFPDLMAGEQAATAVINGLMRARGLLGQGLDDVEPSEVSGELAQVRAERRALQSSVLHLPVNPGDFQRRENAAASQWNRLSQKLQQFELETDRLQAVVNGLERVVADNGARGVVRDAESTARIKADLDATKAAIASYRKQIAELRRLVEGARLTASASDRSVYDDDNVRARYKRAIAREMQLVSQGNAGAKAGAWAGRAAALLAQADQTEAQAEAVRKEIEEQVDKKASALLADIMAEQARISDYGAQLDVLDQEARLVVGQVAQRNFGIVRDRLRTIVVRADVGITEEAWEAREEQQLRVRNLQTERARSERLLNEELREVLDDAANE